MARAAVRAKVRQELEAEADRRNRTRARRTALWAGGVALAAALAFAGGHWLALDNPFKNPASAAYSGLDVSLENVRVAPARVQDAQGDMVESPYVAPAPGVKKPAERPVPAELARQESPQKAPAPVTSPPPAARPSTGRREDGPDSDGLQTGQFDRNSINLVVSAHKKTLHGCLVAEAERRPGLSAKIPIEFVIGNDGKVNKVWVDHPSFQGGPLPECLLRELRKWPFKPYPGEQATVSLSFRIGQQG
ncbi:MAG: AgmX/PglI C-terminal domain-containing protein [Deltaproteobacteria bacterium]|nr:AgmX/PglI C-terminal domain-containing protein [Deltaproteobacteria bacterium]